MELCSAAFGARRRKDEPALRLARHEMDYIAGIGQEKFQGGHFLTGETFFIREDALYFFLCPDCLRLHVQGCSA
ncbi:hypothetical protein CCAX7_55630 [Capsulimonas corticalis]|uniref:Uncharacterized protein n=1 Tax=Capsulimonas corticalis TaxID=2219043 RepID=A0A9N7L9M6_9BACT|nr:hypothetical protein [Capsulimonas corticalis]BDI33512.1 hypothetical protein CCAX7_55630 [Capsulimonas corticalis]